MSLAQGPRQRSNLSREGNTTNSVREPLYPNRTHHETDDSLTASSQRPFRALAHPDTPTHVLNLTHVSQISRSVHLGRTRRHRVRALREGTGRVSRGVARRPRH